MELVGGDVLNQQVRPGQLGHLILHTIPGRSTIFGSASENTEA
jgi:hypothetical protein